MKNTDEWETEIQKSIEQLKLKSRHSYYGFSLEMEGSTAAYLRRKYEDSGYYIQITVCPLGNRDVIITWS